MPQFTSTGGGFVNTNPAPGQTPGTGTNDNAAAGNVGEYIQSTILSGSAISITTGTPANITSVALTAGDWDVGGNILVSPGGANVTSVQAAVNTTSATLPDAALRLTDNVSQTGFACPVATTRVSIASPGTAFLVIFASFTGTCTAAGQIWARRMR